MSNSSKRLKNDYDKPQSMETVDSTMKMQRRNNDPRNVTNDALATIQRNLESNPTASFGVIDSGNNQDLFQNQYIKDSNSGQSPINIQNGDVYVGTDSKGKF